MSRRRKRKLKKKVKVIFIIFFLIIILGGISFNMLLSKKQEPSSKKKEKNKTEEKVEEVSNEPSLKEAPKNSEEYLSFGDGEYKTKKGYTVKVEKGIATVEGNIIVNKTFSLPKDFRPTNPYSNTDKDWAIEMIDKDATNAFKIMQSDATALGLNIYIASGFRGYNSQERIYNSYVDKDGRDAADTYSARPGYSEHQSGLCFDLNSVNDSFANTNEGKWVNENAHIYGFVIRFPKGKEKETGYQYESWHLRYVGKDLAKKLYNNGDWISLEDYYGLSSNY